MEKNVTISEIPKPEPAGGLFFFYYYYFHDSTWLNLKDE